MKDNTKFKKEIKELTIEEKIKLISDIDKSYVMGYIDKAINDRKRKRGA
ncbi:hypothetical protein [Clostridioides sp. ES-S-0001-03]|nr:hypothetical protein [Clostridioides sp. ES-S-0001-03]